MAPRLLELTFVAFDVETTGLDASAHRIVEIGAVRFSVDGPRLLYEQLVNPGVPVPGDAIAVHGITDEMVASSPPIAAVLPEFVRFIGDSVLVAHNASFDTGFFEAAFAEAAMHPPPNLILCTLQLSRSAFPGLAEYNLEALVSSLALPRAPHHRALADAIHTTELFARCVESTGAGWQATLDDLLRKHGPPLRFGAIPAPTLEAIQHALATGASIRIEYRSAGCQTTVRDITPHAIEGYGRRAKVVAHCHLRGGKRTFRLDCIQRIL
jgi:DNA polymerase III epsilon subunit family exonuclease